MSLQPPADTQAYIKISALEAGKVKVPLTFILDNAPPGETAVFPVLCFLLRHSTRPETFLFDLGIHKDWDALSPGWRAEINAAGADMLVPEDAPSALRRGGLDPAALTYACISHAHVDHIGDPAAFTRATYLLGAGTQSLLPTSTLDSGPSKSASHNQTDKFSLGLLAALPRARTRFLDLAEAPALGPFAHALDFFGDGSLYVVDAPGHLAGHVNVLAHVGRRGVGVPRGRQRARLGAAHGRGAGRNRAGRIAELMRENARVRVLLAHDRPWYAENEGGEAFWPGEIPSL
ncbi:hypothetical protein V8D89_003005 [Ganoderma adspersum]